MARWPDMPVSAWPFTPISDERLAGVARNISHHGDMSIPVRDHTYEALLATATGLWRELHPWESADGAPMREVDAIALSALVVMAEDNLRRARLVPTQTFHASLDDFLPRDWLPTRETGAAIVHLDPVTVREPYGNGGWSERITIGVPAMVVLATVKDPLKLATRVAELLTEANRQ